MVPYQNHGIHKSISVPGPLSVSPFQVTRVSFSWREQKSPSQSPGLYECKHGHMLPTPSSDRDKGGGILHHIWLVRSITLRETGFSAFPLPISSLWGPRTQHFQPQGGIMKRHLWARCLLFQPLLCRDVPSLGFFLSFFFFRLFLLVGG